jgi:AraC-like DNA-binding protein
MIGSQPRPHAQIVTHPAPFAETIIMMWNTRQHQDADLLLPEEIAETASLLSRLAHRSKMEPVMCRAARHLQSNPALSVRRLASQLGVREDYLARGLRTVLGTNPNRLASIAHNAKARRKIVNEMTQSRQPRERICLPAQLSSMQHFFQDPADPLWQVGKYTERFAREDKCNDKGNDKGHA